MVTHTMEINEGEIMKAALKRQVYYSMSDVTQSRFLHCGGNPPQCLGEINETGAGSGFCTLTRGMHTSMSK